ncbi:MAG: 16S rRNA (cytosine(1402)-N(4))-methyltransferase [Slackia sp.]
MTKEYRHIPVLLSECLEQSNLKTHHTFVDATLGGAGHSSEVAQRLGSDGVLIGIDQDEMALAAAGARLRNLALNTPPHRVHAATRQLRRIAARGRNSGSTRFFSTWASLLPSLISRRGASPSRKIPRWT